MKTVYTIRSAVSEDAARLSEIYRYYVTDTAVTFEYLPPTAEEFAGRIRDITKKYPYLVLLEGDVIRGYAYAHAFAERAAYSWSAETSIYVDRGAHGRGIGRALYAALEEALKGIGVQNLYARIAYPAEEDDPYLTLDSPRFHTRAGFVKVGEFHHCAYKFGRWYHMIAMEKLIGAHGEPDGRLL